MFNGSNWTPYARVRHSTANVHSETQLIATWCLIMVRCAVSIDHRRANAVLFDHRVIKPLLS
eukprot:9781-Heterococcus_DN1.PRE.2